MAEEDKELDDLRALAQSSSDEMDQLRGLIEQPQEPVFDNPAAIGSPVLDRYSSDNPGLLERLRVGLGDFGRAGMSLGTGAVQGAEGLISYLTGLGQQGPGLLERAVKSPLPGPMGLVTEAGMDYGRHVSSQPIENTLGELGIVGAFAANPALGVAASGAVPPLVRKINEYRDPSLAPMSGDQLVDVGLEGAGAGILGTLAGKAPGMSAAPKGASVLEDAANLKALRPGIYSETLGLGNKATVAEAGLRKVIVDPQAENLLFKERIIAPEEAALAKTPEQVQALHETFKTRVADRKAAVIKARNDLLEAADRLSKVKKGSLRGYEYDPKYTVKLDNDLVVDAIGGEKVFKDPISGRVFDLSAETPIIDPKTGKPMSLRRDLSIGQANDLKIAINNELKLRGEYNPKNPADQAKAVKDRAATESLKRLKNDLDDQISSRYEAIVEANPGDPLINEILARPEVQNFPYELEVKTSYVPQAGETLGDYAGVLSSSPKDMYRSLNARYSALADIGPLMSRLDETMGQATTPTGVRNLVRNDIRQDLADPKAGATRRVIDAAMTPIDRVLKLPEKAQAKSEVQALTQGGNRIKQLTDLGEIRLGRKEVPQQVLKEYPTVQNFLEKITGAVMPLSRMFGDQTLLAPPQFLPPPPLRIEPDSKSVIENKDKVIEDLSQKLGPDAPQVISQLEPALDSKNPDMLGQAMAALMHSFPQVRGTFGDDPTKPYVVFNKKVYTPQDREMVAKLIEDSDRSLIKKARAMVALNKDGTVLI